MNYRMNYWWMNLPGRSRETRQTNSTLVNRFNVAIWFELVTSPTWAPRLLMDTGGDAMCCGRRLSLRRMSSRQPTNPMRTSSEVWCTWAPMNTSLVSKLMTSLRPGTAPCDRWVPSTTISAVLPCRSRRMSCQIPSLTETSLTRTRPSPLPQSKRYCTYKFNRFQSIK